MKYICLFAITLPLLAFISCIVISLVKDFELANQTHCRVKNWLPSISASISKFYPQIFIWRLFIGIDSFPRYLIAFIYFKKYYASKIDQVKHTHLYTILIRLAFLSHLIELTSLLLLSYVSSVEIFSVHKISFVVFVASSLLYMLLTVLTHFWPIQKKHENVYGLILSDRNSQTRRNSFLADQVNFKSRQLKLALLISYIFFLLAALYFYIRHNLQCEPNIYSIFALFEYLMVLTNIAYHSMIFYDMNLFKKGYNISMFEEICKLNYD